jgi:hypothetical protein
MISGFYEGLILGWKAAIKFIKIDYDEGASQTSDQIL